jgi:hypothetical protein
LFVSDTFKFRFGGVGGVGGGTGLRQSRTEFLVVSSSPSVVVNLVGLGEGRGGRGAEGRSRTVAAAGSIISSVYLRPPHMSITPAPATPPRRIGIFPGWSLRLASKSPRGGQSERALRPLMNILEPSGGGGTDRKERRLRGTTKKRNSSTANQFQLSTDPQEKTPTCLHFLERTRLLGGAQVRHRGPLRAGCRGPARFSEGNWAAPLPAVATPPNRSLARFKDERLARILRRRHLFR